MQAVILHTIKDVQHCIRNGLHKNATVFSANINVIYYLKYQCKIKCQDLSLYIKIEENQRLQKGALDLSNILLKELDDKIAPAINEQLDLHMRYFEPLYSYYAGSRLSAYIQMRHCLSEMLINNSFNKIIIYQWIDIALEIDHNKKLMDRFLAINFPNVDFEVIQYGEMTRDKQTVITGLEFYDVKQLPLDIHRCGFIVDETSKDLTKSTILLLELENIPACFLNQQMTGENIVRIRINNSILNATSYQINSSILPSKQSLKTIQNAELELKENLGLLYEVIRNHFCKRIVQYLQAVLAYQNFYGNKLIKAVCWEYPQTGRIGAILLEYFIAHSNVPVIGIDDWLKRKMYVPDIYLPVIALNRCRYYLSRGSNGIFKDLSLGMPQQNLIIDDCSGDMDIKAVTELEKSTIEVNRKKSEVVFYIPPTYSLMSDGFLYTSIEIQKVLLEICEQKAKEVHIICEFNDLGQNALLSMVKNLENIRSFSNGKKYLQEYMPNLIITSPNCSFLDGIFQVETNVILVEDTGFIDASLLQTGITFIRNIGIAKRVILEYFENNIAMKSKQITIDYANLEQVIKQILYSDEKRS